jgi:hypothetical protein
MTGMLPPLLLLPPIAAWPGASFIAVAPPLPKPMTGGLPSEGGVAPGTAICPGVISAPPGAGAAAAPLEPAPGPAGSLLALPC